MTWNLHGTHIAEGDLVDLIGRDHKHFLLTAKAGEVFHSHLGSIRHDDLLGLPWGNAVRSHNGHVFFVVQPSLADLLRTLKRSTQIIYPKDIGFILTTMGIGPGVHVAEAGSGSGALTAALAYAVGPEGRVYSYDSRMEHQQVARDNLQRFGLERRVVFHQRDILDGFEQQGLDAVFLDLPNPYDYLPQVSRVLKSGGFFGSILPTANQVSELLRGLRKGEFAFIDVCETSLRYYRTDPERFRPTDRMVAHTGFLIFARAITKSDLTAGLDMVENDGDAGGG